MIGMALSVVLLATSGTLAVQRLLEPEAPRGPAQPGGPFTVKVTGAMPDAKPMRSQIMQDTPEGLITTATAPIEDADVLVHLMRGWDDMLPADLTGALRDEYLATRFNFRETLEVSIALSSGPRPHRLVVFNVAHRPDWGPECIAAVLIAELQAEEDPAFPLPVACLG